MIAGDPRLLLLGAGVADPKGIFGTTLGAREAAPGRVLETPLSENMLTGALAGLALVGWRPVLVHARSEFALLGMSHIVDTLAKWKWLHCEPMPVTLRLLVGRGWGQGPTHSQSFHAWFASVTGLRTLYPSTPDAYDEALAIITKADAPTILIESRRLHEADMTRLAFDAMGSPDVALAPVGDSLLDALDAAAMLAAHGVRASVWPIWDLQNPWCAFEVGAESVTAPYLAAGIPVVITESVPAMLCLTAQCGFPPGRNVSVMCANPAPLGSAPQIEARWYPTAIQIASAAWAMVSRQAPPEFRHRATEVFHGPF